MGSRLFFGHIAQGTSERDLEKLLKGYGEIREIALLDRYGFVEFRSSTDAKDVLRDFDGKSFRGERLVVEYAKSRGAGRREPRRDGRRGPPTRSDHRLIVRNLTSRANWQDLKDYMRRAGEVSFADAHKDRQGEGIVEFEHYDDMKYALEKFQDSDFRGKRIELIDDSRGPSHRSRRERSRSRSRSPRRSRRSRSRTHSRSPRRARVHRSRSASPRRSRRSPSPYERSSRHRGASPRRRSYSRSASPRRRTYSRSPSPNHGNGAAKSRSPSPVRDGERSPHSDHVGNDESAKMEIYEDSDVQAENGAEHSYQDNAQDDEDAYPREQGDVEMDDDYVNASNDPDANIADE